MKSVYKYTLQDTTTRVMLPKGAEILSIGWQNPTIVFWALVETDPKKIIWEERIFEVFGTGWPMSEEDRKYIGTTIALFNIGTEAVLLADGQLVWHIFEKLKTEEHGDKPELPGPKEGI